MVNKVFKISAVIGITMWSTAKTVKTAPKISLYAYPRREK
jgi:hypothetical protein